MGNGLNLQIAEPVGASSRLSSEGSGAAELLPELLFDMEEPELAARDTGHAPAAYAATSDLPGHRRCCLVLS